MWPYHTEFTTHVFQTEVADSLSGHKLLPHLVLNTFTITKSRVD